ncbi:unnamed protein product [Brachionus calyciflorus]|uniref:L-serine ammonia-lyase n=1 Tax=Brachionus calyciflorus TaxID=104777 RepID=A0A813MLU5_9BILA|nr:unnamed protein product [Brachionus calyciflorus]
MHLETPLLKSHEISLLNSNNGFERNIYLKLDNCQPSGSFKIRGIGHLIKENLLNNNIETVISSSGGNAGLAAACTAQKLGIKSVIITPTTVFPSVVDKLKSYGAEVIIHGDIWDEADKQARDLCNKNKSALYVPPFDNELIWKGNSSIIEEIKCQMNDEIPDCVIASVGGGGLILGLIEGAIRNGWFERDVKIIAVETVGADCFYQSVRAGKIVSLDSITSIAKSLGARTCATKLFEYYQKYQDNIYSFTVSDKEVVETMEKFLNDHRFLVEPSCGASLAVAYNMDKYLGKGKYKNVVVEVCGGSAITLENLLNYKKIFLI